MRAHLLSHFAHEATDGFYVWVQKPCREIVQVRIRGIELRSDAVIARCVFLQNVPRHILVQKEGHLLVKMHADMLEFCTPLSEGL